ncbi:MAG: RNA polymerase subunit sigma-70 [Marinicaulis sp.]|nr:RNA polymerase subunit sigma-70 [Marinicaulis sp.]
MNDARAIAEETARASYGRLLAWLSSRSNDVAAAEDALADAFRAALETWPERGAPNSPEAWLLTAARRKLIDGSRRKNTYKDSIPALTLAAEEAEIAMRDEAPFPDERLKLLFICAHPAIDAGVRTPLMLQTVLGLDAARIASAFLVSPAAMSGRLVRAKRKIKAAAIPFEPPEPQAWGPRIGAVLEAIYAAYGAGWDEIDGSANANANLTGEAIFLARLTANLIPDQGETWGLLSLMLHAEARRDARRKDGAYMPLGEQDLALWNQAMIDEAEAALARAWKCGQVGAYQIEAAIQSAHVAARLKGHDTTVDIVLLYEKLNALAPTAGAAVGYAGALAAAGRFEDGFKVLDAMHPEQTKNYQAWWAVRAHILNKLERKNEAKIAYDRAIGLAEDEATRRFLAAKRAALGKVRS